MSLGAPREETDKSGVKCFASDVAINGTWYEDTMDGSLAFTTFVVQVSMEGLCEKYGDQCNLDRQNWTVLKNKKYLGKLQRHHIQQRARGNKIKEIENDAGRAKIQVLQDGSSAEMVSAVKTKKLDSAATKKAVETISSKPSTKTKESTPKFKLIKEPKESNDPEFLIAEVELPGVRSRREITLDLGEDRIVLEARKTGYILDIFVPFSIRQDDCGAQFHRDKQTLTVTMPLETKN